MDIRKIDTKAPANLNKDKIKKETKALLKQVNELQTIMRAQGKYSILLILQGLDASGKDGAVRELFKYVPAYHTRVKSFKKPTPEEMAHDYLWRVHQHAPEKGMIQIFNRSHYEDILVPSVEGFFSKEVIDKRYNHINSFEQLLMDNDTHIVKCYLNVSKEKQFERLTERTENPLKFWKHSDGDWEVFEKREKYLDVYNSIFEKCQQAPWNYIAVDQNWHKVYQIAKLLVETYKKMDLNYPDLDSERFS